MLAGGRNTEERTEKILAVIDDDGFFLDIFPTFLFTMLRYHRHTIGLKTFVCYDKQENYADIL